MVSMKRLHYLAIPIGLALCAVLPTFLGEYWVIVLTQVLIFGLFAAAVDVISGYAGLCSLGHAAFFGAGGYAIAILLVKWNWGQAEAFGLSMVVVIALAALIGLLSIRFRGNYFQMITLGFSQAVWALAWRWVSLTGGDNGLIGVPRPALGLSWWSLDGTNGYYYFVLAIVSVSILALYIIVKSPFGQTLVGIRESEVRMKTLGYRVSLHAFIGFMISAFFSGLAGILFVWLNQFVSPQNVSLSISAEPLLMGVLGGEATLFGPLLGAFIIVFLKNGLSLAWEHWLLILGAIYVAAIIYMPYGIIPKFRRK